MEHCKCCGSKEIKKIGQFNAYSHYLCIKCSFEFFINQNKESSNNLYENDSDYDADLKVSKNFNDLIQWNHNKAIKFLNKKFKNRTSIKLLDIGCFNGFFVKKMIHEGYNAFGIDSNIKSLDYGIQKYKLNKRIFNKKVEELIIENEKYNIITMFEVLEHLEYPKDFLLNLKKILEKNGILIISTPNNNMVWRPLLDNPPHHFSRFNSNNLHICLKSLGFKKIVSYEQMSISDLTRNYLGSLIRDKNKTSLRGGEFKHKNIVNPLRILLNKSKKYLNFCLTPLNQLLYLVGLRYISQVMIVRKVNE